MRYRTSKPIKGIKESKKFSVNSIEGINILHKKERKGLPWWLSG